MKRHDWTKILFVFLACWAYQSEGSTPVRWSDDRGVQYFVETKSLSIQELLTMQPEFVATKELLPNFGFSKETYWFHVALENPDSATRSIVFEVSYPRLETIDFYAVNERNEIVAQFAAGTNRPFAQRPIDHTYFAFPLEIPSGERYRLYMRTFTENPLRFPVMIWEPEDFRTAQQKRLLIQGIYYGGIAIMVIYNLFVYFGTRHRSYLYYCFFVISTASYLASDGGIFLHYVFTQNGAWNDKVTLYAILGANLFGLYFVSEFLRLQTSDPLVYRQIRWICPALIASAIVVPLSSYQTAGLFYTLLSTITSGLLIIVTFRGLWRRQREAFFYAAAWICLLIGTFAYGLLSLGFIESNFFTERGLQIGSFSEVTILSFALADHLNQMRKNLKVANSQLAYHIENVEEQVLTKTRDIRSIMEHIPIGVFSILPGLVIHKDYSHSLTNLLQVDRIEGQSAPTVLLQYARLTPDQKSQVAAALEAVIGAESIAFDLNRHCFPDQIELDFPTGPRTFELLWNPVCSTTGMIEKVLVTIHDRTRLIHLEIEAETQRRELDIIRQILDVPVHRFQSFIRQAEQWLDDSIQLLLRPWNPATARQDLQLALMNLHSLKGTARSLFFHAISSEAHECEDTLQALLRQPPLQDPREPIRTSLQNLRQLLAQYRNMAQNKLGRRTSSTEIVEIDTDWLQSLHNQLSQRSQNVPELLEPIRHLECWLYRPLPEVLHDCLKSSPRLAAELHKPSPRLSIKAHGFGVTGSTYDLLLASLSHLLRNCLDHGLETAVERKASGKAEQGEICVMAEARGLELAIAFRDDGRGLNLDQLATLGRNRGLLGASPSPQEIAELIFTPDLSTRSEVSMISGRGMGMPALREMLEKEGGRVELELLGASASPGFQMFQVIIVLPPSHWSHIHPLIWQESA